MTKKNRIILLLVSTLVVAACGSSGGTQQPPPPVVTPPEPQRPDPSSFPDDPGLTGAQESQRTTIGNTPEFRGQWSLSEIKADYAYARGYTGEGVTVGIIDTGLDSGHDAFEGKLHSRSAVASNSCPNGTCSFSPIRDTGSHGTAVGGLIAAARLGNSMHGVAYDAELLAIGIQLGSGSPIYRPVNLSNAASFRSLDEQGQGTYRRISGATRIINHSFGYEGVVTDYTASGYRAAFGRTVDSLLQAGTPDSEKMILVWAAGNSFGKNDAQGNPADASSPNITAGTPHLFPELKGHFVTVVATQSNGTIASYSNHCGVAADFCIAAPGHGVVAPAAGSGNRYFRIAGTSAAAPHVAGALALMEEAFREQLGSTEMVTRLFAAADKTGIYANRDIYGEGMLDVEKATRPIGTTSAALSNALDGPSVALPRTAIAPGAAWGDAMQRGFSGREMAVFDSLNAPFFIPMDNFRARWPLDDGWRMDRQFADFLKRAFGSDSAPPAAVGRWTVSSAIGLGDALAQHGNTGPSWSRTAGTQNAWIALGTEGLGIAGELFALGSSGRIRSGFFLQGSGVTRGEPLAVPGNAQGAFLNLESGDGNGRISAELGLLRESERLLGAGADGAYGQLAGNTWFTRLVAERELREGLRLVAVAQGGYTVGEANQGLFRGVQRVLSSAYSAGIHWTRVGPEDTSSRLWLMVSQPLRNESGGLQLDYPVGRTRSGSVLRETAWLDAEPSGRQVDLMLGYEMLLGPASNRVGVWRMRIEAWRSFQPGHRVHSRPESALFVGLSRGF